MGVGSAFAESSAVEGLTRGLIEGGAFVVCFAALGGYLGIREVGMGRGAEPPPPNAPQPR